MKTGPTEVGLAPVAVIHLDPDLLVVDKPAGLLAVPGRGADKQDCLSARVLAVWPDARVVHRLDEATSGLMVFARGALAQRLLGRAFEQREVGKRYVAVVHGRPAEPQGRITLPLAADWPQRPRQRVDVDQGKPAVTLWQVEAADPRAPGGMGPGPLGSSVWPNLPADRTRLVLEPQTGRTHQLRVHLQAIGHPIVGDRLYGPADAPQVPRMLLHATGLELPHPVSGERLRFESAVPF